MVKAGDSTRAELEIAGRGYREGRQRAGQQLLRSKLPSSPPLNPISISIPMDAELMSDRLRRQPSDVQSGDDYIGMDMHDRSLEWKVST